MIKEIIDAIHQARQDQRPVPLPVYLTTEQLGE
jgi:hypothetical protein